jgi:hypothetical protein
MQAVYEGSRRSPLNRALLGRNQPQYKDYPRFISELGLRPNPITDMEGGVERINDGFELMKSGKVSATKLVVAIQERRITSYESVAKWFRECQCLLLLRSRLLAVPCRAADKRHISECISLAISRTRCRLLTVSLVAHDYCRSNSLAHGIVAS